MGDSPCDRQFCPSCDLAVSVETETCPECGQNLDTVVGEPRDD